MKSTNLLSATRAFWARRKPGRITRQMTKRMAVDATLVNLSLAVALFLRYILASWSQDGGLFMHQHLMLSFLRIYLYSAWLLTPPALLIFHFSGFYTRGRIYISRYKALVILQAVTLTYLAFGSLVFLAGTYIGLPRSVLPVGWVLTLLSVGGVRVAYVWLEKEILQDLGSVARVQVQDPRNVLVVGGAGYIGSVLVRKLLQRGYRVRVLDRLLYGEESLAPLYGRHNFELIQGDFRNVESVVRAVQEMNSIIHLGAVVGDPACALDEEFTLQVNLFATRMIAEAAKGYGINRFIFASSCSVYGASDEIVDERSKLAPLSLYARTKIESERLLLSIRSDSFSPVLLRFATACGMSFRPRFDLAVNLLAAQAVFDKRITIFGGDQWRPFVHLDDISAAIILSLEAPAALVGGQVFNVGSEAVNHRLIDIGDIIKRVVPDVMVSVRQDVGDERNYRVSFEKIRRTLEFSATNTVEDAIREIVEAVRSGRIANYRMPQYSNVKWLTENGETAITMVPNIYTVAMRTPRRMSAAG